MLWEKLFALSFPFLVRLFTQSHTVCTTLKPESSCHPSWKPAMCYQLCPWRPDLVLLKEKQNIAIKKKLCKQQLLLNFQPAWCLPWYQNKARTPIALRIKKLYGCTAPSFKGALNRSWTKPSTKAMFKNWAATDLRSAHTLCRGTVIYDNESITDLPVG